MKICSFPLIATLLLAACHNSQQTDNNAASLPQAASVAVAQSFIGLSGTDVRKDHLGGEFTLTDSNEQPFSLSGLKGKVVILAFGFTHCPDVCPTELLTYNDVLNQLGEQDKEVAVVFVSVDPERDHPKLIGQYAKQFNPNFIGLTATGNQQIALVKQQYRVVSAKTEIKSDTAYNIDHTSGAFILDKNGDVVLFERYGLTAEQIANDVRAVLKGL